MCFRIFSDSIPPHFVMVFKSEVPSTRLFKSELSYTCTLMVNFGDLITKIYQSRLVLTYMFDLVSNSLGYHSMSDCKLLCQ